MLLGRSNHFPVSVIDARWLGDKDQLNSPFSKSEEGTTLPVATASIFNSWVRSTEVNTTSALFMSVEGAKVCTEARVGTVPTCKWNQHMHMKGHSNFETTNPFMLGRYNLWYCTEFYFEHPIREFQKNMRFGVAG